MNWKRLLAYITGSVDQELLLCNEYLAAENRILRNQLKDRLRLTDDERITLAEIGKRLGRKALSEVAQIVRPETILAGITPFPNEAWLKQVARNVTAEDGSITNGRFLLHDRDSKFSEHFDAVFRHVGIEPIKLSPQSPNLNAFAERWVRSVKNECLDQLILFGERSLRHSLNEYLAHHQHERNHQGLDNVIPFPDHRTSSQNGTILKSERLGGLLNFYHRAAA